MVFLKKLFLPITLIAALVAIAGYFGIVPPLVKSKADTMSKTETHNVSSYNQSGGVTAHTVNLAQEPRVFNQNSAEHLIQQLEPYEGMPIEIMHLLGDIEGRNFAFQIKDSLFSNEIESEVIAVMFKRPPVGLTINIKDGKVNIIIGEKQE